MNGIVRIFLLLSILAVFINAKSLTDIDKEIAVTKTRLAKNENREVSLQTRTENLSKEIERAKANLAKTEQNIAKNSKEIDELEKVATNEKDEKARLIKERDRVLNEKLATEKELVDLLANHLIESIVLSNSEAGSEKDLIAEEVFKTANKNMRSKIIASRNLFLQKIEELKTVDNKLAKIESRLQDLVAARNRQKELQNRQATQIKDLDTQKTKYLKDLNRLIAQKNEERQMLADLRILRQQTVDALRQEQISKQEAKTLEASKDAQSVRKVAVKQIGTSYQQASRSNYNGKKVKAPLDDRHPISVVKEFGPYTDPIYNIKIHNDSVTLKSANDSIVRSVLPGKVIFADDLKLLGKVVIVEHSGNMHTIYRNLESISPNIKKNRQIAQRESIGRVASELVFEVTKNGLPINPMQLIALK